MDADLRSEIAELMHEAASAHDWADWFDRAAIHFQRTDLRVSASRFRRLFDRERCAGLSMIRRLHRARPARNARAYVDVEDIKRSVSAMTPLKGL